MSLVGKVMVTVGVELLSRFTWSFYIMVDQKIMNQLLSGPFSSHTLARTRPSLTGSYGCITRTPCTPFLLKSQKVFDWIQMGEQTAGWCLWTRTECSPNHYCTSIKVATPSRGLIMAKIVTIIDEKTLFSIFLYKISTWRPCGSAFGWFVEFEDHFVRQKIHFTIGRSIMPIIWATDPDSYGSPPYFGPCFL